MEVTTTLRTMVTPAPYVHADLLIKRADVTCGDLRGAYPNVQAPICAGATSICTFSNALQGCCDSSGSCQFYTTCNGRYSPATCTDKQCISCSSAAPYCIKYNFYDSAARQRYDGYSCGAFDVGSLTVQGYLSSIGAQSTTGASSGTSSLSSSSQATTSGSQTPTNTSISSTPTDSAPLNSNPSSSNTGAIVGGVVGTVCGLLLIGAYVWYKINQKRRNRMYDGVDNGARRDMPEIQQTYGDGASQRRFTPGI